MSAGFRLNSTVLVCVALAWTAGTPHPVEAANSETRAGAAPQWELENPIRPIPRPPLGIQMTFMDIERPPIPEQVRLGRWLFHDKRLSADGTVSCASCHRTEYAFSEPVPVSTGIDGKQGTRKAPSIANLAWTRFPRFFWDGRATSLEDQALGPLMNPVEMGNPAAGDVVRQVANIAGYAPYFDECFGSPGVTIERVAAAIAAYERTCMSGDSPWDRWRNGDDQAVDALAKRGHRLFFGRALCSQCHFGQNLTDDSFHNVGIGWDAESETFSDEGRAAISGRAADTGAFKTPGLRDVALRAPYMHDGSLATLREVVEHYRDGGLPNPHLSPRIRRLGLSDADVDALLAMLRALSGQNPMDAGPTSFPR